MGDIRHRGLFDEQVVCIFLEIHVFLDANILVVLMAYRKHQRLSIISLVSACTAVHR